MIKFVVPSGGILVCDNDASLIFVKNNSNFLLTPEGDWTLPIMLAPIASNFLSLNFANLPNNQNGLQKLDAAMYSNDEYIGQGVLTIMSVVKHRGIEADFVIRAGNLLFDVWSKSIRDMDFGYEDIPYETVVSRYWGGIVSTQDAFGNNFIPQMAWYVEFWIAEQLLYAYSPPDRPDSTKELLIDATAGFNAEFVDLHIMYVDGLEITYWSDHVVSGVKVIMFQNGENVYRYETVLSNASYEKPNYSGYFLNKIIRDDFVLAPIEAIGYYGSEKSWNGKINNWDYNLGQYYQNSEEKPTGYSLVPGLSFRFLLEKLIGLLGYDLDVDTLAKSRYNNIILYTNTPLDKQCKNIKKAFNVWQTKIMFAKHLPDWKVSDVFDILRFDLGLNVKWNVEKKKIIIRSMGDVLQNEVDADWSKKLPSKPMFNYKSVVWQLAYESALSDEERGFAASLFESYPKTINEGIDFVEIKIKLSPLSFGINEAIPSSLGYDNYTILPRIKHKARSEMFDLSDEKLVFGAFLESDLLENYYTPILSLRSVYQLYLSSFFSVLFSKIEIEEDVFLTNSEWCYLDLSRKKRAYDMDWIVSSIETKLPISGLSTVKMLRC